MPHPRSCKKNATTPPKGSSIKLQPKGTKLDFHSTGRSNASVKAEDGQSNMSGPERPDLANPPLLFKVERVLGVHRCLLSQRQIIRDFIQRYNCTALSGHLDHNLLPKQPSVGKLTSIDRYLKVRRYLEKRQKRIWKKTVSYTCRKDTADKRLRIKGRFIKKED